MPLIQLKSVSAAFGGHPLLDQADLSIDPGERIGLIGRNGSGKSTLLKIIDGSHEPDEGEIAGHSQICITRLAQEVPPDIHGEIRSVIAAGDELRGSELVKWYCGQDPQPDQTVWELDNEVKKLLSIFTLSGEAEFGELSGGLKRRALLARSLVSEPQLLLLDEPTNHLDIESIEWMETLLTGLASTLLFISHDRSFINNVATRIIELDRGKLSTWPGNFDAYMQGKVRASAVEDRHNSAFDKKLANEERWIRQGIKAQRTRNEGRVRALEKMRRERGERRNRPRSAQFELNEASRSGDIVIQADDVIFGYKDIQIVDGLSTTIVRGDRVGIIGPNGCGKSTLIRLLTGELEPSDGTVSHGTRLRSAYLDQHRGLIQDDLSVLDNVSDGRSEITINGKTLHIITYLREFLFSPDRLGSPAKSLSGGERNRLVLAMLFTRPFNLLILDEPTNDLDIETLELLEQLLIGYQGTLLLVSHDRSFLDNIVTSTLAFEDGGTVCEYVGGYKDWMRQSGHRSIPPAPAHPAKIRSMPTKIRDRPGKNPARKLSYKDKRALETLPAEIETLEASIADLQKQMASPGYYTKEQDEISDLSKRLRDLETSLENKYARWEELV